AADGWSLDILRRELAQLNAGVSIGVTPVLPAVELHYSDFAAWQREWMSGPAAARQLAHWRHALEAARGSLPLNIRSRFASDLLGGAARAFPLASDVAAAVRAFAAAERVTPFVVWLAAFFVLLYRHSGQDDLVIGVPVSGRTRRALESIVGCFAN